MKAQITGDRNWKDKEAIKKAFLYHNVTEIIEGEARGADSLAREVAEELGLKVYKYPADWDTYKKSAGPIRNRQMLKEHSDSDFVLAFHDNINESKGTRDMVKICLKANKKVYLYHHKNSKLYRKELENEF